MGNTQTQGSLQSGVSAPNFQMVTGPSSVSFPVGGAVALPFPNNVSAWGPLTANQGLLTPFTLPLPGVVTRVNFLSSVTSGNIDVGIYSSNPSGGAPLNLLGHRGLVACPGVVAGSPLVTVPLLVPISLAAGAYWAALSSDNATVTCGYLASGSAAILISTGAPRYNLPCPGAVLPSSAAAATADFSGNVYAIQPAFW